MNRFVLTLVLSQLLSGFSLSVQAATQSSPPEIFRGRNMPYEVLDSLPVSTLKVGSGVIDVFFAPGQIDLPKSKLLNWVSTSAEAVATYYGHFPVRHLFVLIVPIDGIGVRSGAAYGNQGAAIKVSIGRLTNEVDLNNDWEMTHEMVHLAFPDVSKEHHWIEEGIATYVEPIARAQAGKLDAEKVWEIGRASCRERV